MKIQSVANRGIGQFCVMLRDDPVYRDRCAARVAAGRADHLVKFSLEEELKPRGKLRAVSRGRFAIIYPDHDRDPNLKPDIHTEQDQKYWEAYLRSRARRLAAEAEATNVIEAARSRFPVLDQVLQPGLARERFVHRWRLGKVGKSLEILILRIAAIMDLERKRRRGFRIVMYGRFRGDPMALEHQNCAPPCRSVWAQRQEPAPNANHKQATGAARGRAGDPMGAKAKTDSPKLAAASKPRIQRPGAGAEPAAGAERIVEIHGQEFVMDPDIGDGPE